MFTRKRIKKYFLKHPDELNSLKKELHEFSNQKENIIKDEDIPSFDEFLVRKEGISHFFRKDDQSKENKSAPILKPWYRNYKFIAPITIALMLCVFIVLTPVGHAFTKSIYNTFVQWFGDEVIIHHGPGDTPPEAPIEGTNYYNSFSDIRSILDVDIVYNDNADLAEQIEVFQDDSLIATIRSIYKVGSQEIIVTQTIYCGETEFSSTIQVGDGEAIDEVIGECIRFIGSVQDGSGYAVAYIDNVHIQIRAEETDYNTFIGFIRGIQYE